MADLPPDEGRTPGRAQAAVGFTIAAAVGLAFGELAAGIVRSWSSPVQAVAESVIDRSPQSVTSFGIETFGDDDKTALIVGILVILAIAAPMLGILARRHRTVAPVAFGLFGLVGLLASADGESLIAGMPAVIAALGGYGTWYALDHLTRVEPAATDPGSTIERRRFILAATSFAAVGVIAGSAGRALRDRFSAATSRAQLVLPEAAQPLEAAPQAASFDIDGLAQLYTPNDSFYRIDTALTVPQVPVEGWTLKVKGMVDEELELTFDELTELGLVETDITLTCVSNQVGGELVGNARWLGIPLRTVLDMAGVQDRADQIVGRSDDDYTCGFPVEAAYDREAIIAVGMNGEPLPLEHGFPARLVTAGLYGYVSATKWLTEIELTRFDEFQQYWAPRGYAEKAPIKTMARIDVPQAGQQVTAGDNVVAGVAWSQPDGISKVEVKIDDADFAEAELAEALNDNTWRQWRFPWNAPAGNHRITVRATDGNGELQTDQRAEVLPDGASGWQSLLVIVQEAA